MYLGNVVISSKSMTKSHECNTRISYIFSYNKTFSYRFTVERFRSTVHVLGANSEHVLLALGQTFGGEEFLRTEARHSLPVVQAVLSHLDDVA